MFRFSQEPLVLKSFLPDVPIAVDASCCAGVTPESHINALKAIARGSSPFSRAAVARVRRFCL